MMLSSITSSDLRTQTAAEMWRNLRPGGHLVSYDFWLNPKNPDTVGITRRELRRLFPEGRFVFARTVSIAPPIGRFLSRLSSRLVLALEKLRVLNSHYLVAIEKPAG